MRRIDDYKAYEINNGFTEQDFNNEKENLTNIFYTSFKKIRRNFLILFFIETAAFGLTYYMIYFQNALFAHPFFVYIMCIVFTVVGSLTIVEFKNFRKEERRYFFRINSLVERVTNKNLFLNIPKSETDAVIKKAYIKYGINVKAVLILFVAFLVVFYGIIPAVNKQKLKFTPQKWQNIENRLNVTRSLKEAIDNSIDKNGMDKFTKCDFSDKSYETFISILGVPEVQNNIFRGNNEKQKNPTYDIEMGNGISVIYNEMAYGASKITVLQYYCGESQRGLKQWLLFVFVDGKYSGRESFSADKYGNFMELNLMKYLEVVSAVAS